MTCTLSHDPPSLPVGILVKIRNGIPGSQVDTNTNWLWQSSILCLDLLYRVTNHMLESVGDWQLKLFHDALQHRKYKIIKQWNNSLFSNKMNGYLLNQLYCIVLYLFTAWFHSCNFIYLFSYDILASLSLHTYISSGRHASSTQNRRSTEFVSK